MRIRSLLELPSTEPLREGRRQAWQYIGSSNSRTPYTRLRDPVPEIEWISYPRLLVCYTAFNQPLCVCQQTPDLELCGSRRMCIAAITLPQREATLP